ncbi:WD40-repeat-containing domain protein [Neurospora hispaniola]|uniref:WD40-repeat-containing domain protein n=1 Tax=Neurospora hispaniola TaxID=588809 RepID=A0AAJ0IFE7_9PEZI|nr:WD40-repeat-containing domain protein [Neurospora hispaniola]
MADNSISTSTPLGVKSSSSLNTTNNIPPIPSSPPPRSSAKERRNPSITPRKFRRFFTPRVIANNHPSASQRALRDLAGPLLERSHTPSSPLRPISEEEIPDVLPSLQDGQRSSKRRKITHASTPKRAEASHVSHLPSPAATSPALLPTPELKHDRLGSPIHSIRKLPSQLALDGDEAESEESDDDDEQELPTTRRRPNRAPIQLDRRGLGAQLVQRVTGGMPGAGNRFLSFPVSDWRSETADFYSRREDAHFMNSHEGHPRSIPFCTTSCNTKSLVAVGDEEGYVRLLDTQNEFSQINMSFQAHGNAIIDMAFSDDDLLLATASGDQTGKVLDFVTQQPISILGHHTASLKQVRFQPGRGANSVLATTSRDGSVQIWDLRCRGGPVQDVAIRSEAGLHARLPRTPNPGCVVNSIYDAHSRIPQKQARNLLPGASNVDVARIGEVPGRLGEVSVTALQFLPPGREHLFLTACEADASVKLWDIRAVHTSRHHKYSTPVSFTAPLPSHANWRPFGISSMALGGDGSRLYTLCKDNTVYAYSTAHLVLGHAVELTAARPGEEPPRRRHHNHGTAHEGLGPLYGFRHPLFHATSFYVKSAIRPAKNGHSELLAVGSSDGAAVLFPTDERYIKEAFAWQRQHPNQEDDESYLVGEPTSCIPVTPARPRLTRSATTSLLPSSSLMSMSSSSGGGGRPGTSSSASLFGIKGGHHQSSNTPIIRRGTPLVRGHEKEVGALTWTLDGSLVTASDDYLVRCWREGREEAADLRTGGETGGRRWGCGWADVGDQWDGDVDDW